MICDSCKLFHCLGSKSFFYWSDVEGLETETTFGVELYVVHSGFSKSRKYAQYREGERGETKLAANVLI